MSEENIRILFSYVISPVSTDLHMNKKGKNEIESWKEEEEEDEKSVIIQVKVC